MDLLDGLQCYKDRSSDYWRLTLQTEQAADKVLVLLTTYGNEPPPDALDEARKLLISIERWKAMCLRERMGNAETNPKRIVWNAFQTAINATSDYRALRSIMDLKGFGITVDPKTGQRRAKVATSVLRFLKPEDWGVVDWRTLAILEALERATNNIDLAISQASKIDAKILRSRFDIIGEGIAVQTVQKYRKMRAAPPLARAADIDMALFGLSLKAWRM
jgi:hypothetical protein